MRRGFEACRGECVRFGWQILLSGQGQYPVSLVLNTIRANVGLSLKKTGFLESDMCCVYKQLCVIYVCVLGSGYLRLCALPNTKDIRKGYNLTKGV